MKFDLRVDKTYQVEAKDEADAFDKLEERFGTENTTAENEFWNIMEAIKVDDVISLEEYPERTCTVIDQEAVISINDKRIRIYNHQSSDKYCETDNTTDIDKDDIKLLTDEEIESLNEYIENSRIFT